MYGTQRWNDWTTFKLQTIKMKQIKITFFLFFLSTHVFADNNFYNEGLIFYEKKQLEKAKFKFEQDLVLNPKNEKSYLYLSKIFNFQKKNKLEEQNLNSAILNFALEYSET